MDIDKPYCAFLVQRLQLAGGGLMRQADGLPMLLIW